MKELELFDEYLSFLEGKGYKEYKRGKLRTYFLEYLLRKEEVVEK